MEAEELANLDPNIPKWKRELILRRRAVGRVLSTGSGSVQLTCPSVVAAVRLAEFSVNSDFLRSCESEREQTGGCKNMRLIEQVNASDDFVEPCVILGIKEIITKIESSSSKNFKMGEDKNGKKIYNHQKNSNEIVGANYDDDTSDSSEEFKYGPGIVSRLKSKYLSLTLRESQGKTRPTLDSLRRATSLENILNTSEPEKLEHKLNYLKNIQSTINGSPTERCRGMSRSNKDSIKRARSVEVLTRYEKSTFYNQKRSLDNCLDDDDEDRRKARNRINSSNVEEKELPPPDLVKHTLKIFENSQSSKNSFNLKKKNQKNGLDYNCAKKPVICPKPCMTKQNNMEKNCSLFTNIKKVNEKHIINTDTVDNASASISGSDLSGTVERRKAILFKETPIESMINKTPVNKSQYISEAQEDDAASNEAEPNNQAPLDLIDLPVICNSNRQKTSPNSTSPKPDTGVSELSEPKRCISPVLIRAPPSILSAELNSNSSPTQHMKQVGVIRPIVTNKHLQSNLSKPNLNKSQLTEREIEKNLINKVKSIEQPVTKVIVSLKKSPEECFVNDSNKTSELVKKGQFWDKKPNTMVFNFSNRKTVPDYIENDGLILAHRKEKSKLGESGIVLLSGGTEDSSTDFDGEDFTSESPLPCDITFEGDNILINGRSNIQTKPKLKKMKIQFNDEATTLFEYPSEASLLDEQDNVKQEPDIHASETSSSGLPMPFCRGNLATYTPSKVSLATDFQLGVTKTSPPPPPPAPKATKQDDVESEDEQLENGYLRPADENATVAWSSETAADLLF